MTGGAKRPKIPLIVWVGLGVFSVAGLIAAAVFVPALAWLGPVLGVVAAAGMAIDDVNMHSQWQERRDAAGKRYREFMAAFGVRRTGRTINRSGQDFSD